MSWLTTVGTPFGNGRWRTAQLLGQPLIGALLLRKNHLNMIDVFVILVDCCVNYFQRKTPRHLLGMAGL